MMERERESIIKQAAQFHGIDSWTGQKQSWKLSTSINPSLHASFLQMQWDQVPQSPSAMPSQWWTICFTSQTNKCFFLKLLWLDITFRSKKINKTTWLFNTFSVRILTKSLLSSPMKSLKFIFFPVTATIFL